MNQAPFSPSLYRAVLDGQEAGAPVDLNVAGNAYREGVEGAAVLDFFTRVSGRLPYPKRNAGRLQTTGLIQKELV